MFKPRIALLNPNTSVNVTDRMVAMAEAYSGDAATLFGLTAKAGPAVITSNSELALAEAHVESLAPELGHYDAVIIAGFGDPGLSGLRALLEIPVAGIGEASLLHAGEFKVPFAVVTTTPELEAPIVSKVRALGLASRFAGVFLTDRDMSTLMDDPELMVRQLVEASQKAASIGVGAIVVGGGPLAQTAKEIADATGLEVINPVWAAMKHVTDVLRTT